jgi:predicted GIY-YIG superfamily endonuclease
MLYDILKIMKKMNKKIFNFSFIRTFSTSKLSFNSNQTEGLVLYEDKNFLKPILKVQDKLLAPIVYNENILEYLQFLQSVLYKLPNSNLVKLWLKTEFEQDKIIINAKLNKGADKLLNKIKKIENEIIENTRTSAFGNYFMTEVDEYFSKIKYFYSDIERDELYYGDTNGLFSFNDVETGINKILKKGSKKSSLFACSYIITFDNKFYYYIGSTTNIKNRFKVHTDNINNYYIKEYSKLNEFFFHFLDEEHSYSIIHKKDFIRRSSSQNIINFDINVVYLSTNYLNKFKQIYPSYKLSKVEKLLLNMTSDFVIKTLEQSLLIKFQPKLNIAKKVNFKYSKIIEENINNKNNSPFSNKSSIRSFSTSKISYNNNCAALNNYKNEIFFKPILKVENELLAPIVLYENVVIEIEKIKLILFKIPNYNFVKLWLFSQLEQDKIIINVEKNKEMNKLLKKIKQNNLNNNKDLFIFKDKVKKSNDEFYIKSPEESMLYACCYIITFNNKNFYYIGSSSNLRRRFKKHKKNILNYILYKKRNKNLNDYFKNFLYSEINNYKLFNINSKIKKSIKDYLKFDIGVIYLCTNYFKKFKNKYPEYELNEVEIIILKMITDFFMKILELSLIENFKPKLNIAKNVSFKTFMLDDYLLEYYIKNIISKKYFKNDKFNIYIKDEVYSHFKRRKIKTRYKLIYTPNKYKDKLIYTSTLEELCYKYNFNIEKILNNLNNWHIYEETKFKIPLKIVEIT